MKLLWASCFCFSYQFHMGDVEIKTCFVEERGSQTGQRAELCRWFEEDCGWQALRLRLYSEAASLSRVLQPRPLVLTHIPLPALHICMMWGNHITK